MPHHPKLLLLVICAEGGVYKKFQQCWRDWALQNSESLLTFFVKGDTGVHKTCLTDDMTITTPRIECLVPGVLEKTIDAMQFVQDNYRLDYLVRTNLSSFWRDGHYLRNFFSRHLPASRCYAGYTGFHQGQFFASGAGIILSTDVVMQVLKCQHLLDWKLPDDVAIGKLVQQQGIAPITPLQNSRHDIVRHEQLPDESAVRSCMEQIYNNSNVTHVRLKNPDRDVDVALFRSLLEFQGKILSGTGKS